MSSLGTLTMATTKPTSSKCEANVPVSFLKWTTRHIMEHIKSMAKEGQDPQAKLTENELVYYLFVLHDTNNDGHLDGHELRAAFTDFDEDEEDDPTRYVALDEITDMVDHVLEEDDLNGE